MPTLTPTPILTPIPLVTPTPVLTPLPTSTPALATPLPQLTPLMNAYNTSSSRESNELESTNSTNSQLASSSQTSDQVQDSNSSSETASSETPSDSPSEDSDQSVESAPAETVAQDQGPPDVLARPLAQNMPRPEYPERSRRRNQEGTVVLRARIDEQGGVLQVEVVGTSGHSELDQAAQQTVQTWSFSPATRGGRPIASWVNVSIDFTLQ